MLRFGSIVSSSVRRVSQGNGARNSNIIVRNVTSNSSGGGSRCHQLVKRNEKTFANVSSALMVAPKRTFTSPAVTGGPIPGPPGSSAAAINTLGVNTLLVQIQIVARTNPDKAITMIENAWKNKELPINDLVAGVYINAATSAGKIKNLDMNKLRAAIVAEAGSNGTINGFGSSAIYGSSMLTPGSSPANPIYTNITEGPFSFGHAAKKGFAKFVHYGAIACAAYLILEWMGVIQSGNNKSGASGGGGGNIFGGKLGLGKAPVRQAENSNKRFTDVVGCDEAKAELQEIVQYLKDPARFTRLGATLPRGVLLLGPPGTGKTLLAKAIAGEAGVPFFYASGSEFEEMFVGVGASRVRELFQAAKARTPCIVFLDEIDAMGGSRNLKDQSAMKMTVNQLLTEMDGFESNPGVIVIGATNFADSLDKALLRPGRFDKHVEVPAPDIGGRLQILELYGSKVPCDDDVDFDQLARGTPGFTGADLYNLVNHAALKAAADNLAAISMSCFEYAKDKIMMGAERRTAVISPESMKCTAFHEAGHALVALKTDGADPIHKATIMPRGRSLGMVMQLPDGDQVSMSRKQMLARMDVCMGGRVAEELVFGVDNVTSGASSDIQQATRLARAMVMKFGLSDKVGCMYIDEKESPVADRTTVAVDSEVRQMLEESYARAKKVIMTNRSELDNIANGLLSYESLSGKEIADLAKGIQPATAKRSMKPSRELKHVPMPSGPKITTVVNTPHDSSHSNNNSANTNNQNSNRASSSSNNNMPATIPKTDTLAPPPAVQPVNQAQLQKQAQAQQQQQQQQQQLQPPAGQQTPAANTRGPPKA
jgi:ATP-dependent metalloprotease